jgi:hypothetical protein
MEPGGDKTLNWAVTRIGQVILFWGTLQLLLGVLDGLTNSDLLMMVRLSMGPQLGSLAEPWVVVVLVVLGFALIWESTGPKKTKKSLLDQNKRPDAKNYPVRRVAGLVMPLFLAFVCGLAFGGYEWSSPSRGQVARQTSPASTQILSGAVHHRPQFSTKPPAASLSASTQQPGTDRLAGALPHSLTPALDEDGQAPSSADVAGANPLTANLPADPRAAIRMYAYNGARRIFKSGQETSEVSTPQRRLFDQIQEAHQSQNWWLLATLSEGAIKQTPQWLTPYLFAGEAYTNLGKLDRAILLLEYVKKNGAGNPDYDFAIRQATQLRESIRQHYRR